MSRVRTKAGVVFGGFTPSLCAILAGVCEVASLWQGHPEEIVITSGSDGAHHPQSKHYTFQAIDLRAKNFHSDAAKARFVQRLREALGPQFTILHEARGTPNEHFHVQLRKGLDEEHLVEGGEI